jgi:hypothetical protein
MTARILTLPVPMSRQRESVLGAGAPQARAVAPEGRHTWRGASGRRYRHEVYSLVWCPPLSEACYVLVRRDAQGRRTPLHVGLCGREAASLNLARIRQRGATLGANEVHVYDCADWDKCHLAVCDLRAGAFGELGPEPARVTA